MQSLFESPLFQEHITILLVATLINILFAHEDILDKIPHFLRPTRHILWVIRKLEQKLNRLNRSNTDRLIRGAVITVLFLTAGWVAGKLVADFIAPFKYEWVIEAMILALLLPYRQTNEVIDIVMTDFERISPKNIREQLGKRYLHDMSHLGQSATFRAGLELAVQQLWEQALTLMLAYLIFGLPGAFTLTILNLLNGVIGHTSERLQSFGTTSSALHLVLMIPTLPVITLLLLLAPYFAPLAKPASAIAALSRNLSKPLTLPYAVMAGATDTRLLGPLETGGEIIQRPWVEEQRSDATTFRELRTVYYIFRVCSLMIALILLLIANSF